MLNKLWAGMLLIGIIFAALTGRMDAVTNGMLEAAKEAVTLSITMLGVMSFWMGMMEVATKAGLVQSAAKKIEPVICFLFPNIPEGHKAKDYITTNFIANILGLGWAATPAGLRAMEELGKLEEEREISYRECEDRKSKKRPALGKGAASDEMCTFLVLNISSLQLIPVNVIAYRSQYGSVSPTAIVGPGIVATLASTLVAVVFCKIMCRKQ
ncbi:MAG: nucleoside recognition protein [Hespellia sp.]|nr:nucleoside recognition protein [Hespellia sp.]